MPAILNALEVLTADDMAALSDALSWRAGHARQLEQEAAAEVTAAQPWPVWTVPDGWRPMPWPIPPVPPRLAWKPYTYTDLVLLAEDLHGEGCSIVEAVDLLSEAASRSGLAAADVVTALGIYEPDGTT